MIAVRNGTYNVDPTLPVLVEHADFGVGKDMTSGTHGQFSCFGEKVNPMQHPWTLEYKRRKECRSPMQLRSYAGRVR